MKINTKIFLEIEVDQEKVLTFEKGIIGFPQLIHFLLIHEQGAESSISWLQSIEEPMFALPVIDPLRVMQNYDPCVEDELLKGIELNNPEDMLVVVTMTVPSDVKKVSVNLKAPIVINSASRKACQLVCENEEYEVKYAIYNILKSSREEAGE